MAREVSRGHEMACKRVQWGQQGGTQEGALMHLAAEQLELMVVVNPVDEFGMGGGCGGCLWWGVGGACVVGVAEGCVCTRVVLTGCVLTVCVACMVCVEGRC